MKVIINDCYGGFSLSHAAFEWLIKNKDWEVTDYEPSGYGYINPHAQLVKHKENHYPERDFRYSCIANERSNEMRTDKDIIEVVETLKEKADGDFANLKIIEIPDDVQWEIGEYDGSEWVQEVHRRWE